MTVSSLLQEPKINKHIARIFQNGNSYAIRVPHDMAERFDLDEPGSYALVTATTDGVVVKRIKEETLN
jgi:hypothetical protein